MTDQSTRRGILVTAAGTLAPSKVMVLGAGVAGLQAIATARRLGAVVEAYDTRPAAAEQVESLGARFVALDLDAGDAEDAGGYARAQDEAFYARQRERMGEQAAEHLECGLAGPVGTALRRRRRDSRQR